MQALLRLVSLAPLVSLVFIGAVFISGCTSNPAATASLTERQYYEAAQNAMDRNRYTLAVEQLQQLESRYPFGKYAEHAQLALIYSHYHLMDYESAAVAAERFIRRHPDHPLLDYALYMKGLAAYSVDRGFLERILPTDFSERDMGPARESFDDFTQLITRFPDSPYAADARQRMIHLRNLIAAYEIKVAEYYMERGAYVAVANRASFVIDNFDGTAVVPEALVWLAKAYLELGYQDLAANTVRVLAYNYPDHPQLRHGKLDYTPGQRQRQSLLNIISFGLFN